MAVLEAEGVAELVDHGVVVVVAGDRVLARVAEPDVAAGDGGVGIVGVGGVGVGVVAEADGAGAGAVAGEEDVEVGEALDREAEVARGRLLFQFAAFSMSCAAAICGALRPEKPVSGSAG